MVVSDERDVMVVVDVVVVIVDMVVDVDVVGESDKIGESLVGEEQQQQQRTCAWSQNTTRCGCQAGGNQRCPLGELELAGGRWRGCSRLYGERALQEERRSDSIYRADPNQHSQISPLIGRDRCHAQLLGLR